MAAGHEPLAIVNDFLLAGMKTVGDLFASGEMQLPFVLQSAETMKSAVAHLEPHMERADQGGKGKVVLATVKGDVHDIGKNLVDIIFTNNGYEVVNLGIKVGIAEMIAAVEEHRADALGMSGLLVKSTLIMRENLEELNTPRAWPTCPVLLGGAALTRTYVERDLRQRLRRAASSTAGTPSRACGPWTGWSSCARRGEDDPELRAGDLRAQRAPAQPPRSRHLPGRRPAGPGPRGGHRQPALPAALRGQPGGQGHRRSTTSPST